MTARIGAWRVNRHANHLDEPTAAPNPRPSGRTIQRKASVDSRVFLAILFLAAHVPLALAMDRDPQRVATPHAWLTLAAGVWVALSGRIDRVAVLVGYMVGAEVLWRMTDAQTPWEYAKYAAVVVML